MSTAILGLLTASLLCTPVPVLTPDSISTAQGFLQSREQFPELQSRQPQTSVLLAIRQARLPKSLLSEQEQRGDHPRPRHVSFIGSGTEHVSERRPTLYEVIRARRETRAQRWTDRRFLHLRIPPKPSVPEVPRNFPPNPRRTDCENDRCPTKPRVVE